MRIYDVIQNDAPTSGGGVAGNGILAWKFPGDDFYDKSQLIVHESEEAVFFKDGLAMQVFEGGRYTLDTSNHPFLTKLRNRLSEGKNAFTSQIYFVNRAHRLELKWGTDTPIQVRDPIWGIATKVTARGSYSVQIADSKRFLVKLIGNVQVATEQELSTLYRSAFSQHIKDAIADHLMGANEEILNVANKKSSLAATIKESLAPLLEDYGIEMVEFFVAAIDVPDDEYRHKVESSIADRQVKMQGALGDRGAMDLLGEDWARQQSSEILRDLANNPGAGGIAAAGAGLGLGVASSGVFGEMARNLIVPPAAPVPSPDAPRTSDRIRSDLMPMEAEASGDRCANCAAPQPAESKFCSECGTSLSMSCEACGTKARAGTKFCAECGTKLGDSV